MSLISASLPNLFNGVSQQPFVQRLVSQGEIQINAYSSLVEGLRKRPPSSHVAKLLSSPLSSAYLHTINRSTTERYTVIFTGSDLLVYDIAGNAKTVTFPQGKGYVTTASDPSTTFTATTVADYTFVVNKNRTVTADATQVSPTRPFEALVWIKAANYACKYAVQVGGRLATKNTMTASTAANQVDIQTSNICNDLYIMLTTGSAAGTSKGATATTDGTVLCDSVTGSLAAGITITNLGSSLYITSATDFSITASDGAADSAIQVIKGSVNSFSNLPARGQNGMVVQINGTDGSSTDGFWAQYQADANNPYGGLWVECPKPGEGIGLQVNTMPHILVRNSDGTFTFQEAAFKQRTTGSLAQQPWPSFVGRTINDVFFYQSRLGVLAGESVIMGVATDTFNFFRASAQQLIDTDPIDVSSSSTKVSTLLHAIPFQGSLLLFAEQTQLQLSYSSLLSPKTVEIAQATTFVCNLQAKPVNAGPNVYFAIPKGTFTGVREFYLDGAGRVNDATDVTSHVPKYIPGNPVKMAVASNEDCLVVLADGNRSELFVYRYYWQQAQKMQSSWSVWQFAPDATILNIDFIVNTLYVVTSRSDGVYLESINVQPGVVDGAATFACHLDRKVSQDQCAPMFSGGVTTVTLPYAPDDWTKFRCVAWVGDPTHDFGRLMKLTSTGANTATLPGNCTQFFIGRNYTFQYRFSTFTVREPVPMTYTQQAVTEGKLQIRNALVNYSSSGYFRAEVTPFARSTYTYVMTGSTLGVAASALGGPTIQTGVFKFPVQTQNLYAQIDLINDSYLPCAFMSAGWEGFFVLRSRRM